MRQRLQEPVFLSLSTAFSPPPLPRSPGCGLGLAWPLPCSDPLAQCFCGRTNPAGSDMGIACCPCHTSGGLHVVLVISLWLRIGAKGPEHSMSYESSRSKLAYRCPPCRAWCHRHYTVTQQGLLTQSPHLLGPAGSTLSPQPSQAAMSSAA